MVITVTCPSCASSFPVDPAKIPERGVNVRCSKCSDIFRVERPAPAVPAAPPKPAAPKSGLAPATDGWSIDMTDAPPPELTPQFKAPAADPFAKPAPFEQPAESPGPATSAGEAPAHAFTFGKRDPTDKAKRLARVLVSDMIMYNAERHQTALENGTLLPDFEDEIEKSWKEFVDQVGEDLANGPGRGFWKEALNDILAKGERLF